MNKIPSPLPKDNIITRVVPIISTGTAHSQLQRAYVPVGSNLGDRLRMLPTVIDIYYFVFVYLYYIFI